MKAWQCDSPTGIDALRWVDLPTPVPTRGQVRIRVCAASLNFPDLLILQNKYQIKPEPPFVPGCEFAGTVDAIGDGVTTLRLGDRVATFGACGGFATHACAQASALITLPDGFELEHGAAFAFTLGTAHHALMDRAALRAGQTVLVLGAAGGVGSAAVQVAKAAGARVLAVASDAAKCGFCQQLGADVCIDTSRQALRDAVKSATDGRGADIVVDPVGGTIAEAAFRSIAWRGRYLVIGFAAGGIPALPWNLPLLKGASVVGVYWGDFVRREPGAFQQSLEQLFAWYAQGRVRPAIGARLPMQSLPEALARMTARQVLGKLLLVNEGAGDAAAG